MSKDQLIADTIIAYDKAERIVKKGDAEELINRIRYLSNKVNLSGDVQATIELVAYNYIKEVRGML